MPVADGGTNELNQRGWVDSDEEPINNIPKVCPKCGCDLWVVNAANSCGVYLVMCRNFKCRWGKELKVE